MNFLKTSFLCSLVVLAVTLSVNKLEPAPESINRIMAIVGKISISQLDFERGEEIYFTLRTKRSSWEGKHK